MEYQFLYFVSMFLKHYLHIEGTENTNLIALVGLAYIVGRGLNVLVSAFRIPVTSMLYLNTALLLFGSALIVYITPSSDHLTSLVTVAVILMGLGYASSLPGKSSLGFRDLHRSNFFSLNFSRPSWIPRSLQAFTFSLKTASTSTPP